VYKGLIEAHTRPTLCSISDISPNGQGGQLITRIYSFSRNSECNARSTAHQGVLYLVQCASASDARGFLRLTAATPAFVEGWQGGRVAILLGKGVPIIREVATAEALKGKARFVFRSGS
jgi:hypothetical protein